MKIIDTVEPTATTATTEEKETTVTDGTSFSTGTTDGVYSKVPFFVPNP